MFVIKPEPDTFEFESILGPQKLSDNDQKNSHSIAGSSMSCNKTDIDSNTNYDQENSQLVTSPSKTTEVNIYPVLGPAMSVSSNDSQGTSKQVGPAITRSSDIKDLTSYPYCPSEAFSSDREQLTAWPETDSLQPNYECNYSDISDTDVSTDPQTSSDLVSIKLTEINTLIVCPLCAGYINQATRIIECHHVFCKSCIILSIHRDPRCPICYLKIECRLPITALIHDKTYQLIIDKLLPSLKINEVKEKRDFYMNIKNQRRQNKYPIKYGEEYEGVWDIEVYLKPVESPDDATNKLQRLITPVIRGYSNRPLGFLRVLIRKSLSVPTNRMIRLFCEGKELLEYKMSIAVVFDKFWSAEKGILELSYMSSLIHNSQIENSPSR